MSTDSRLERERLREAVRDTIAGEEQVVRGWVREALRDLLSEAPAEFGRWLHAAYAGAPGAGGLDVLVGRLVEAAVGARESSPARQLAIFQQPSDAGALPPAAAHAGATYSEVSLPPELLVEPLTRYVERDPYPLPTLEDREGYHAQRHFDYWKSGLEDWLRIGAVLRRHGVELRAPAALLDLGCASGRLLRHALCQAEGLEVWGAELNERHVAWLLAHLPERLRVFQCTTLPSLPLSGDHFDLVTALSVFTHIDEFELAWLAELRRILKPGGIAYFTIHGEHTWNRMGPGVAGYENMLSERAAIREYRIAPELFRQPMPHQKTVIRWTSASLNNTNVFVSERHVRSVWGRFFEVLEIVPEGCGYQDVVVLRKSV